MTFLVDTSIWSLVLRRPSRRRSAEENNLVARLDELIREGRVAMIGVIRQELLTGIRTAEQFHQLRDVLSAFPDESLVREDYEVAADLHNQCLAKGIAGSTVDLLICAVAARREWTVFTRDHDFERYADAVSSSLKVDVR